MAKFVESAILKVIDQSSRNLNKITKSLKTLREEGKRLKNINVNINTTKVAKATGDINRLGKAMKTITTPKIGMSNINATLSGLRKIQNQVSKLNSTAVNIRVRGGQGGGIGGGGGGRGGRGGRGYGPGGGGTYRINASALDIWAAGFITRLGSTIESAIVAGFREGTKNVSQSELRNQALGYTPDQIEQVNRDSRRLSRENPNFTASDFRTLYAEIGPTLGNDPMRVKPLMDLAAQFGNSRLTQTGDPEEGLKGIRSVFKALDNINQLQGADGNISGDAKDYLRVMIEESILSGADINPEKINTAAVYARTTGKTLTPEGFRTMIAMLESMGRVAGSSLNRFVENLSGNTTTKALANQAEWGLIEMKQTQTGTSDGKKKTANAWEQTAGGTLLREDPNAWVVQEMIPRLLKKGIDINNASAVANEIAPLFGSVVAKDVALNLVTWQGEYQKRLEAARNIPSNDSLGGMVDNNGYLAALAIQRQAVEVMGEIGTTITEKLLTPLQYLRDSLIGIADFLGGRDENGERNAGATAAVGGGGVIAAMTALWAGSKATGLLKAPFVFSTGLDTATTALGRFTVAVNGASAGGAVDGLPGGDGKAPKGKKSFLANTVALTALGYVSFESGKEIAQQVSGEKPTFYEDGKAWLPDFVDLIKNGGNTLEKLYNFLSSEGQKNVPGASDAFGALPGTGNISQEPPAWKSFLFGDAANPDFDGKDVFGIEIGAERGSNKMLDTFTQGASLISSGGSELGSNAGAAIMGIAGPFGAAIAAALQANFNPGTLQVQVSASAPANTGANTNNAR